MIRRPGRTRRRPSSVAAVLAGAAVLLAGAACRGRSADRPEVVVYTSVDEPRSEPVLRDFERETGIRVLAVHDVEAAKTTGLASRLLAERAHPRADLFWSSEPLQTAWLAAHGVLGSLDPPTARDVPAALRDPAGRWIGLGLRFRVILVNVRRVPEGTAPRSVQELLRGPLADESGMAMPLFGTAFTQAAALFAAWGPERAERLYRDAVDAGVRVLDGNARVASLVADGTLAAGLTDTDDARAARARGAPVAIRTLERLEDGGIPIPGTVALVAGGPDPDAGRRLAAWLLSRRVEARLVADGTFERSVRTPPPGPVPDWNTVARELDGVRERLREVFLR